MIRRIYHALTKIPVLGRGLSWIVSVLRMLRHARGILYTHFMLRGTDALTDHAGEISHLWRGLESQKLKHRYLAHIIMMQEKQIASLRAAAASQSQPAAAGDGDPALAANR